MSGTMTTIRPGLPSGMNELILNVYRNIPQEFQRFLELSQDFIHMGSHLMASAYVLKVNQFMEEAKGAVVQNMSVAGSQISYDSRSNVVEPWMTRNGTFLNRASALSRVGSSLSAFKRPLPPTNRKHLRPTKENLPPPCHVTKKRTLQELSSPVREDRAAVQNLKKKVPREDNRAPEEIKSSRKRAPVRQDREILGDVSEAPKTIKKSESKENNKRPLTAKADTTVTKKRKLLPTVEDNLPEISVQKLLAQHARPAKLPAGEANTSGSKRVPSTTRKQLAATKRSTAELLPPSPVTTKKKQANVVKKPGSTIKLSLGGTPQIDFDISLRSFLSCDESSEDEM